MSGNSHSGVTLTLLVRAYCHLCDEMLAGLRPLVAGGTRIAVVDVDALFTGAPQEETLLCTIRLVPAAVQAALAGAR